MAARVDVLTEWIANVGAKVIEVRELVEISQVNPPEVLYWQNV
jgi:hypothetical protein